MAALGAIAFGGLAAVDSIIGIWYRTGRRAKLHVTGRSRPMGQMILVFPGFAMPAKELSEAFRPHLGSVDVMIVVQYAERGVDMDDICAQIFTEVARHPLGVLRVYGPSMGGMCAIEFLYRYRAHAGSHTTTVLVLDTAPSQRSDIRMPLGMSLPTSWYRGGPVSSILWRVACLLYRFAPSEPDVDAALVRDAQRAFAATGMPTLTTQAQYVNCFSMPRNDDGTPLADRAFYLRGRPSGGDPIVHVESSVSGWREVLPGLQTVTFDQRKDRWHVPIIERPRETMSVVLTR